MHTPFYTNGSNRVRLVLSYGFTQNLVTVLVFVQDVTFVEKKGTNEEIVQSGTTFGEETARKLLTKNFNTEIGWFFWPIAIFHGCFESGLLPPPPPVSSVGIS